MSVYLRDSIYFAYIVVNKKRFRKSLKTKDLKTALEKEAELKLMIIDQENNGVEIRAANNPMVSKLYHSAKRRAKIKGTTFELTKKDADYLFSRAGKRCELTGLPFMFDMQSNFTKRPYIPSIDRIDNSKGYTLDNCRIVCLIVNIAINEWGEDIFSKMAHYYVKNRPHQFNYGVVSY